MGQMSNAIVGNALSKNAAEFDLKSDDVFARISGRYGLLCNIFSLGIHRLWKAHMASRMSAHEDAAALDVASGTGDIPLRLLKQNKSPRVLWVTDICPNMLAIAKEKLGDTGDRLRFANCDAEDLRDFKDETFDLYSISFGMKICDREKVVREAYRVLRPGGRFYCLEAARIRPKPLHVVYLAYMNWCMPLVGRFAADGDASAYLYLLRGIQSFPDQDAFAQELRSAGFQAVSYRNLTAGIVALHEGTKPACPLGQDARR